MSLYFFLLKGKVPSVPGKVEELASLSLLFLLQKSCPYSLNVYALGRDKVVSKYVRFRSTISIIPLLLTLIIFDIWAVKEFTPFTWRADDFFTVTCFAPWPACVCVALWGQPVRSSGLMPRPLMRAKKGLANLCNLYKIYQILPFISLKDKPIGV